MALDDILFLDGDAQLFISEIVNDQVESPVDILFDKDALSEISVNFVVSTSLDYLFDRTACEELPKNRKIHSVSIV